MNQHELGRIGENSAALWLEERGWEILARNLRLGHDEIDILARKDGILCFAEVKTRRQIPGAPSPFGEPADAVNAKKQASLVRAAGAYLAAHPGDETPRIDVIEVYADPYSDVYRLLEIRVYENAVRRTGKFSYKNAGRGGR
ncbi:MAG: YraN family protein [Clostridia bacterium]|nr:YraN family protein [Clostridia bacterium]